MKTPYRSQLCAAIDRIGRLETENTELRKENTDLRARLDGINEGMSRWIDRIQADRLGRPAMPELLGANT